MSSPAKKKTTEPPITSNHSHETILAKIPSRKPLGETLIEMGLLTPETFQQALDKSNLQKLRLGELLVKDGTITDSDLAQALAHQFGVEYEALDTYTLSKEALKLLPEKLIRANFILPIAFEKNALVIAVYDPLVAVKLESVLKMMRTEYVIKVSPLSKIIVAIETAFSPGNMIDHLVESLVKEESVKKKTLTPVPKPTTGISKEDTVTSIESLIDRIIDRAIHDHGSDIHIDPSEKLARIRIRVDGLLHVINSYPMELHPTVISRLKVLARMDISEKRVPQDGRFSYTSTQKTVDIRISTLPTIRGEKAVMRIIDKSALKGSFEALGMDSAIGKKIDWLLARPHGIFFVTGPTGSGKTTTLYAMLSSINDLGKNIITVEDPVEYQFDIVNQVQVHEKAGLNFAGILRNILRQDPDVMMIGEIRDKETADIAIQAALTGHLVLSTLHTNDAISTATRLIDMGIEPFLLASAMLGVLSQRLVRVLCPHCRVETKLSESDALLLGKHLVSPGPTIYEPKGCDKCYHTGYLGRVSLFELLIPDKTIQEGIVARKQESDILDYAESKGFIPMRRDGIAKILAGVTSVEEVIKVTI